MYSVLSLQMILQILKMIKTTKNKEWSFSCATQIKWYLILFL